MMKLLVSNKLYIKDATNKTLSGLKKSLTIPNPAFQVMLRKLGAKAYHIKALKRNYCYYDHDKDNNIFSCGRGNLNRFKRYFDKLGLEYDVEYDLTDISLDEKLKFNGKLRDYQIGVADTIIAKGDYGIIKLGTGFGKTIIACEIIRRLNKTALIIVPRVSLLNQFKETLKEFYDYECGVIQGSNNIIKDITVASASTLKKGCEKEIADRFSLLLFDEVHTCISEKGIKMVEFFRPLHLYGLTATPKRSDGQGEAINYTFGGILINKALPQDKPTVQVVNSNVPISGVDYMEMVSDMVKNEKRNELISSITYAELLDKRKILILTKRIEHYKIIEKEILKFRGSPKIFSISSKTPQKERDILLTKLRNNESRYNIILGTYSMLSTGVDIPSLETIIFAGDLKSEVLCEQSVGRILRLFKDKKNPKVIDINDNLHGLFHRQFLARRKFYKDNNWEIL